MNRKGAASYGRTIDKVAVVLLLAAAAYAIYFSIVLVSGIIGFITEQS